jgi:TetR/AcrR family transcriptional regulator
MPDTPGSKAAGSTGEQAILDAAETLFAKKGFDAVSMSAIASLANSSKPNIYHHFKNKHELYLAIMKNAVRKTSELLDTLEDAPGSFRERLTQFSAGQLGNILSHRQASKLVLRETLSGNSERGREIAKHLVGNIFSRLIAMIEKGQRRGEFRNDIDATLVAFMIVSANSFFFQASPLLENMPEINLTSDAGTYSQGVMEVILNGLLTPQGAAS